MKRQALIQVLEKPYPLEDGETSPRTGFVKPYPLEDGERSP
jgi:hypothetical protein